MNPNYNELAKQAANLTPKILRVGGRIAVRPGRLASIGGEVSRELGYLPRDVSVICGHDLLGDAEDAREVLRLRDRLEVEGLEELGFATSDAASDESTGAAWAILVRSDDLGRLQELASPTPKLWGVALGRQA